MTHAPVHLSLSRGRNTAERLGRLCGGRKCWLAEESRRTGGCALHCNHARVRWALVGCAAWSRAALTVDVRCCATPRLVCGPLHLLFHRSERHPVSCNRHCIRRRGHPLEATCVAIIRGHCQKQSESIQCHAERAAAGVRHARGCLITAAEECRTTDVHIQHGRHQGML